MTQHYDAILAPTGLKATQFSVLAVLSVAGRLPLSRAAEHLTMDRTTLTRNLRPLERRGWVRVERGEDRRERMISLSRAGRAVLDRALPLWDQAQASVVRHMGRGRWDALRQELGTVIAVARAERPPSTG